MATYNIVELHFIITDDGDHALTNGGIAHDTTADDWFRSEYPHISDTGVGSGDDCYFIERSGSDERDEFNVTIYRYFSE